VARPALIGILLLISLAAVGAGGYWLGSWQSLKTARGLSPHAVSDSGKSWSTSRGFDDAPTNDADGTALMEDPARSLDAALAMRKPGERSMQLRRLGETWARSAPEDAWQEALRVEEPRARLAMLRAIITEWADAEPEKAFASVAELAPGWQRHQLLQQVSVDIARHDPLLALDLVSSKGLADSDAFRALVVDEWGRSDPAGAAQWIERQNPNLQAELAYRIADAYVGQQPQEALNWALRISRSPGRPLWAHTLGQMAAYDPHEALRIALSADNSTQRNAALSSVLRMIAKSDPALAMSELDKLPAGNARSEAAGEIAQQMAQASLASAVDWLNSLDAAASRQAWSNTGAFMAYRDPDGAVELLDRVPQEVRSQWIGMIGTVYAQNDPAKAVQWVRKFEDEPGYTMIVQQVVMNAAGMDPDAALDYIGRLAQGKQREQILAEFMPMIAHQQPETAARMLDDLTDADLRAQAVTNVAVAWAQSDLPAARKWVMSMTSGSVRDQALSTIIVNASHTSEDVLSLIGQIQSPELRQNAVLNAAMQLSQTNHEAMRSLLHRYPLDPRYQQHFEAMLQQQGVEVE
jgi:hypothetical protein